MKTVDHDRKNVVGNINMVPPPNTDRNQECQTL
jgi:hypothetical protein